jgi:hypothetical protein
VLLSCDCRRLELRCVGQRLPVVEDALACARPSRLAEWDGALPAARPVPPPHGHEGRPRCRLRARATWGSSPTPRRRTRATRAPPGGTGRAGRSEPPHRRAHPWDRGGTPAPEPPRLPSRPPALPTRSSSVGRAPRDSQDQSAGAWVRLRSYDRRRTAQPPLALATYAATSWICCSLSVSAKGGITPCPFVTRSTASSTVGCDSSRFGPTVPVVPASASV